VALRVDDVAFSLSDTFTCVSPLLPLLGLTVHHAASLVAVHVVFDSTLNVCSWLCAPAVSLVALNTTAGAGFCVTVTALVLVPECNVNVAVRASMPDSAVYLMETFVLCSFTPPVGNTVHQSASESMRQSALANTVISVLPAADSTVTVSGVTVKLTFFTGESGSSPDDDPHAAIINPASIVTDNNLLLIAKCDLCFYVIDLSFFG
jgi:hypothetical protein